MIYEAVQMPTLQQSIGMFFYEIAYITKIGLRRFSYIYPYTPLDCRGLRSSLDTTLVTGNYEGALSSTNERTLGLRSLPPHFVFLFLIIGKNMGRRKCSQYSAQTFLRI